MHNDNAVGCHTIITIAYLEPQFSLAHPQLTRLSQLTRTVSAAVALIACRLAVPDCLALLNSVQHTLIPACSMASTLTVQSPGAHNALTCQAVAGCYAVLGWGRLGKVC